MSNNDEVTWFDLWFPIVFLIIAMIFVFVVRSCEVKDGMKEYNNGICRICGGTYEFVSAVGHKYETNYIYRCDNCGHKIEIADSVVD